MLPLYKISKVIERKKEKYIIVRPDGSIVNDFKHTTYEEAEKHLDKLIAFKYCRGE